MSTKLDLFVTKAMPADDVKTPLTDRHVNRCTCRPVTSSTQQRDVTTGCRGNGMAWLVCWLLTCAVAFYSIHNNRLLTERIQLLEQLAASQIGSEKVDVSKTDTTTAKPEVVYSKPEVAGGLEVEEGSGTVDIDDPLDADLESSGEVDPILFLSELDQVKVTRVRRSTDDLQAQSDEPQIDDGDTTAAAAAARGQRPRQGRRQGSPRQRDRTTSGQRLNNQQMAANANSIKVAQFVAPRRDSHYVTDQLPPVTYKFWQPDNMTSSLGQSFFSHLPDSGIVTILEPGIYLLYAQIVYHDLSGRWAFGVYVDDREMFKCINTEQLQHHPHLRSPSPPPGGRDADTSASTGSRNTNSHSVYKTCATSGLLKLEQYNQISLRCLYGSKSVVMQPAFTYWGLVKLMPL